MKRNIIRGFVFLAVTGLIVWLVASKLSSEEAGAAQKKKKSGPGEVLVTTAEVRPTTLVDTLSTVGSLVADESLAIKNEVPGKVTRIGFEEGERVERGDLLLQMRSSTLRARMEVQKQRKVLLETQVERQRRVLDSGGLSQESFDKTLNELKVIRAEIQQTRAELDKTTVRAPFDGTVGIRQISPGAILTTGTTVAHLRKLDPIEVEFTVPERYAPRIEPDQEVRFRVHGSEDIHSATVSVIEPALNEGNRTLTVRARTDNPDGALRAGAYAQVRVAIDRIDDALTVPATALTTTSQETYVWLSEDGTAKKRVVQTGKRTENEVLITDGLSAGDVVVTTGRQNVRPGASLKVDTSEDAMDVETTAPDPTKPGMRNKWFSEEPLEEDEEASETDATRGQQPDDDEEDSP